MPCSRRRTAERQNAWENGLRLAGAVDTLILDHHLLRSPEGAGWLAALAARSDRRVCCAADFMRLPRRLLEAERPAWYRRSPVPADWHARYEAGEDDLFSAFRVSDPAVRGRSKR